MHKELKRENGRLKFKHLFLVLPSIYQVYNLKVNTNIDIICFYIFQIRISPFNFCCLGFVSSLMVYTSTGPLWHLVQQERDISCSVWWAPILYIKKTISCSYSIALFFIYFYNDDIKLLYISAKLGIIFAWDRFGI